MRQKPAGASPASGEVTGGPARPAGALDGKETGLGGTEPPDSLMFSDSRTQTAPRCHSLVEAVPRSENRGEPVIAAHMCP